MLRPSTSNTLGEWTSPWAESTKPAIWDRGVALSYAQLHARATHLAGVLCAAGYRPGDIVATVSGNSADHIVLFFACAQARLVFAPLSWRLTSAELAQQLTLLRPKLLVAEHPFADLAFEAMSQLAEQPDWAELGRHAVEASQGVCDREAQPSDPLLIVMTSGTTGGSRAVVLTHDNCYWTNRSLAAAHRIDLDDVVLTVLPQYHVAGWNVQPLEALRQGATLILERSFDPGRALRLIEEHRVTCMMGVPTIYQFMAAHPDFADTDLSSLRAVAVGGAPAPLPLLRTWHERGVLLRQGYGLSEAAPNVLTQRLEDVLTKPGSVGQPYEHVEVALAGPDGSPADVDEGELLVRGPNVFAGYLDMAEASKEALVGGWLRTGDLARRDADGDYTIVDRMHDIFISGGESISPTQIEGVLAEHPQVSDVAVVGVPDARWGEVPVAWVVAGQVTDDELRAFAAQRLAKFKVPTKFIRVTHLPRDHVGKMRRRDLLASRGEA